VEEREREGGSRGMPKTRVGKPRREGGRGCPLSEIINAPVYSTVLGLEGASEVTTVWRYRNSIIIIIIIIHLLVSQGIGHKS